MRILGESRVGTQSQIGSRRISFNRTYGESTSRGGFLIYFYSKIINSFRLFIHHIL